MNLCIFELFTTFFTLINLKKTNTFPFWKSICGYINMFCLLTVCVLYQEAVVLCSITKFIGQKEPLRLIILISNRWRGIQTCCLLIIDIMKNEHMSTIFSFWGDWRWVWGGGKGLWSSNYTVRQSDLWIQMYDATIFLVIKISKQVFSLPGGSLVLLFSSNLNLLVGSLSPSFLQLCLICFWILGVRLDKSHHYSGLGATAMS